MPTLFGRLKPERGVIEVKPLDFASFEGYGKSQAGLKIKEVGKHRLYGFELLPAPCIVAHLQIDIMLRNGIPVVDLAEDEIGGSPLARAILGWRT